MRRTAPRLVLPALLAVLVAATSFAQLQSPLRRDADRLQQKIDLIAERGLIPRQAPLRTIVTETEINSYLAVYGRTQLPAGVVDPHVGILGPDRISGRAMIDLDAVRRASSGSWFDPASYLTGRLPVTAQGVLRTGNGVARFQLESAQLAGITIPKTILQQIITHYSQSPDYPRGINLDDPFPLPAGIRQIDMRRGSAVVVQR